MDLKYDANGYIESFAPVPSMEGNPWTQMAQQSQGNMNTAMGAASSIGDRTNQVNGQINAMNQYGMQTQAPETPGYPAMNNDFGLGSDPGYGKNPSGSTDRGNPWMLQGDALAR